MVDRFIDFISSKQVVFVGDKAHGADVLDMVKFIWENNSSEELLPIKNLNLFVENYRYKGEVIGGYFTEKLNETKREFTRLGINLIGLETENSCPKKITLFKDESSSVQRAREAFYNHRCISSNEDWADIIHDNLALYNIVACGPAHLVDIEESGLHVESVPKILKRKIPKLECVKLYASNESGKFYTPEDSLIMSDKLIKIPLIVEESSDEEEESSDEEE